jgi:hypothetical protein
LKPIVSKSKFHQIKELRVESSLKSSLQTGASKPEGIGDVPLVKHN